MTDRLRPENVSRLANLEKSTGALTDQLEILTHALEELAVLRQQSEHTHTQAELAVVTSLDATNEVSKFSPQLTELRRTGVTWTQLRHRTLITAIWGLVGILALSYLVVSGQQVFSKHCQFPAYLTPDEAEVCNMVFIGDRLYEPGVQTTNKIYKPAEESVTNG